MRMHRTAPIVVLAVALVLAACEASGPSSAATDFGTPPPTSAGTDAPVGTPNGSSAATTAPSAAPSGTTVSPAPVSPAPSSPPPAPTGSADPTVCTGSDANRTFFANTAAAVAWDVYCPVLPRGWFVEAGSFRAASGGWMTISYKTSAGLRLELKEGAFCTGTADQCGPLDSVLGPASFGDREGQLGQHGGNLVLYVNPGASPAWQATGLGLDEATFRAICEALIKVPG